MFYVILVPIGWFTNAGNSGRAGIIQQYTIPASGRYRIRAGGARGGRHSTSYGDYIGMSLIILLLFRWIESLFIEVSHTLLHSNALSVILLHVSERHKI